MLLKPLSAGAKNVTVKIVALNVDWVWNEPHYATISSQAPRFTLPLAKLVQSGKVLPGGSIIIPGFVVQIVGVQAVLNQAKGEVTLTVKHQTVATGTTGKDAITNVSVSIVCTKCDQNTSSLSRNLIPNTSPQLIEDYITFKYDPTQPNIELGVNSLSYTLNGPWQVTVPMDKP